MEFRIAPIFMVIINLVLMLVINPLINTEIALSKVSNIWQFLGLFAIIFAMSIGAFIRHSYYSKTFKAVYYVIQVLNIGLAVYYVYAIRSQHLG